MAKMMLIKRGSRLAGLALGLVSSIVPGVASADKPAARATSGIGEKSSLGSVVLEERLTELITTSGEGAISLQPDAVRLELGVDVLAKTAAQARNELARKMERLTKAIQALEEQGLVVQTALLRLEPVLSEAQPGKPSRITGYRGQNSVSLTLREVSPAELGERAARLVDAGVTGGANVVGGISFFLSRPNVAQAMALRLAIEDAERNAKTMAAASGVSLGKLHSMEGGPERVGRFLMSESFAKAVETTIEPGEIKISASVTARFHFMKE
jgi:uncharacterized protein